VLLIHSDPSTTSVLSAGQPQTIASLRVYPGAGADADFILFTDDGTTYACEKGGGSIAKLHWDEAQEKLTHEGGRRVGRTGRLNRRCDSLSGYHRDRRALLARIASPWGWSKYLTSFVSSTNSAFCSTVRLAIH